MITKKIRKCASPTHWLRWESAVLAFTAQYASSHLLARGAPTISHTYIGVAQSADSVTRTGQKASLECTCCICMKLIAETAETPRMERGNSATAVLRPSRRSREAQFAT